MLVLMLRRVRSLCAVASAPIPARTLGHCLGQLVVVQPTLLQRVNGADTEQLGVRSQCRLVRANQVRFERRVVVAQLNGCLRVDVVVLCRCYRCLCWCVPIVCVCVCVGGRVVGVRRGIADGLQHL